MFRHTSVVTISALVLLLCALSAHAAGFPFMSCRSDGDGHPVGGWVALKPAGSPKMAYLPFLNPNGTFQFSSNELGSTNSAVGATINALLQQQTNSTVGWIMYNDEEPSGKVSSTYGHAKGLLAFSTDGGFWLLHSVPKFPDPSASYYYPSPQTIYGQSFSCLTFGIDQLESIAEQLLIDYPQVYSSQVPPAVQHIAPTLTKVASGQESSQMTRVVTLRAVTGEAMVSFAKSRNWGKDLYAELVAPYLQDNLLVETWMRPHRASCCPNGPDGTECNTYTVENVSLLNLSGDEFKETADHSKWAICKSCGDVWCVGGINRNESQRGRGGGTLCGRNANIHNAFRTAISEFEACPS